MQVLSNKLANSFSVVVISQRFVKKFTLFNENLFSPLAFFVFLCNSYIRIFVPITQEYFRTAVRESGPAFRFGKHAALTYAQQIKQRQRYLTSVQAFALCKVD